MASISISLAIPCGLCGRSVSVLNTGRCVECRDLMCSLCIKLVADPNVLLCKVCVITGDNVATWWENGTTEILPSEYGRINGHFRPTNTYHYR